MRICFLILILFQGIIQLHAQKKPLDFLTPRNWPALTCKSISNNGKYIVYTIKIPAAGSALIVQAIDGSWKKEISGVREYGAFTEDSRRLIFFTQSTDSLGILELGSENLRYIGQVLPEFNMPKAGNGHWLVYRPKQPANTLVLLDLFSGKEKSYSYVETYMFNNDGRALVMGRKVMKDSISSSEVVWLDLDSVKATHICHDCQVTDLVFDDSGTQLALKAKEQFNQETIGELWYYRVGMDSAESIIDVSLLRREGLSVGGIAGFSKEGDKIFLTIDKVSGVISQPSVRVELWSYWDEKVENQQESLSRSAAIHLNDHNRMVYLQKPGDDNYFETNREGNGDYALVERISLLSADRISRRDIFLISVMDGTRKLLGQNLLADELGFSVGGKYVIWYDKDKQQWFAYNIVRRTWKCITDRIHVPLHYIKDTPSKPVSIGIAGWLEKDEAVLIYDEYDIWQVDPDGLMPPVNLTRGYGGKNNIELRYLDFHRDNPQPIRKDDTLLLWGFDLKSKFNSFFALSLSGHGRPEKLPGGSKVYYFTFSPAFPSITPRFYPLKAKNADVYIVRGMNTAEYPNLYSTSDFKRFERLTGLAPQKEYNWYTTELVHWNQFDGSRAAGILFKPENFDPSKKYPVIFYYYEKSSDALHFFVHPDLSNGCMNIPWFVSNGYLVFVPDISYKDGHPGQCAYNTVVSAANYLSKLPYIDSKHMGLQGHSYGGFETDYIVTHTGIFAAAAPAAGMANIISQYGQFNKQRYYEQGQGRMGATLWTRPDLYIENSAIFKADKVTTPILIMHNKRDGIVSFSQEEQWFNGLARLGKKVWMLSYNGEDHTIDEEENQLDYSIRLAQFFDHYLRGAPPPIWMTSGILAGKKNGLELDYSGKTPE